MRLSVCVIVTCQHPITACRDESLPSVARSNPSPQNLPARGLDVRLADLEGVVDFMREAALADLVRAQAGLVILPSWLPPAQQTHPTATFRSCVLPVPVLRTPLILLIRRRGPSGAVG